MDVVGNMLKMNTEYQDADTFVNYYLLLGGENIHVNELIGNIIRLTYEGRINCIKCGKITKKSFSQGFCYNCFMTAPEADPAIIKPEMDQSHLGICRDMEWAKKYSLVPHVVYLAVSSGLKVGVTRKENRVSRWVDQGAHRAVVLAETPYRNLAGQIEVELKKHFADKTNWRKMLTGDVDMNTALFDAKVNAASLLPDEMREYISVSDEEIHIRYPVTQYPEKVTSINMDKESVFEGKLKGIKGQYLIFEHGFVINIRKYNGYLMRLEV